MGLDIKDKIRILHICSNIIRKEKSLNDAIDELLLVVGITKEEINGKESVAE